MQFVSKSLKFRPKLTKISKTQIFETFHAIFVYFSLNPPETFELLSDYEYNILFEKKLYVPCVSLMYTADFQQTLIVLL